MEGSFWAENNLGRLSAVYEVPGTPLYYYADPLSERVTLRQQSVRLCKLGRARPWKVGHTVHIKESEEATPGDAGGRPGT